MKTKIVNIGQVFIVILTILLAVNLIPPRPFSFSIIEIFMATGGAYVSSLFLFVFAPYLAQKIKQNMEDFSWKDILFIAIIIHVVYIIAIPTTYLLNRYVENSFTMQQLIQYWKILYLIFLGGTLIVIGVILPVINYIYNKLYN